MGEEQTTRQDEYNLAKALDTSLQESSCHICKTHIDSSNDARALNPNWIIHDDTCDDCFQVGLDNPDYNDY